MVEVELVSPHPECSIRKEKRKKAKRRQIHFAGKTKRHERVGNEGKYPVHGEHEWGQYLKMFWYNIKPPMAFTSPTSKSLNKTRKAI